MPESSYLAAASVSGRPGSVHPKCQYSLTSSFAASVRNFPRDKPLTTSRQAAFHGRDLLTATMRPSLSLPYCACSDHCITIQTLHVSLDWCHARDDPHCKHTLGFKSLPSILVPTTNIESNTTGPNDCIAQSVVPQHSFFSNDYSDETTTTRLDELCRLYATYQLEVQHLPAAKAYQPTRSSCIWHFFPYPTDRVSSSKPLEPIVRQ